MSSTRLTGMMGVPLVGCAAILAASCGEPSGTGDHGAAFAGAHEGGGPASHAGERGGMSGSGSDTGGSSQAGSATGAAGTPVIAAGGASSCSASPAAPPGLPKSIALDADAVARAAVVLGSCVPDDGVDRNATHLWSNELTLSAFFYRLSTQLDCLANAACGCEAVQHCYGWGMSIVEETCEPTCSSGVFETCGEDEGIVAYTLDCGRLGMACNEAGCAEPGGQPCADDGYRGCDGDRFIGCSGDQTQYGPSCSDLGLTCAGNGCRGTGAACSVTADSASDLEVPIAGTACSGEDLVACVNGAVASIECASRGPDFSCQNVDQTFFCGLASECIPASNGAPSESHPASCEGDELVFCNAGRLERIDCTSLGFTGCGNPDRPSQFGCVPGLTEELGG